MKVFVLGRPGSGKSSAARHIKKFARRKGFSVAHVNDYAILHEMFRADKEHKYFRSIEDFEGFDVIDFSVMDAALGKAEEEAKRKLRDADIVVIEFARNDYGQAFKHFNKAFLNDAYFLFIDVDVNTCIQRVHNRVKSPEWADDYFVSEQILKCYYSEQYIPPLVTEYGIAKEQLKIIRNKGDRHNFDMQINRIMAVAFEREHLKHSQASGPLFFAKNHSNPIMLLLSLIQPLIDKLGLISKRKDASASLVSSSK